MEDDRLIKSTMIGWIDKKETPTKYGAKIVVRDYQNASDMPKYPNYIGFDISSKKINLIDGINEGDKVKVEFFITGIKGNRVSDNKPYQINKLMVGGLTLIARTQLNNISLDDDDSIPDDMPF